MKKGDKTPYYGNRTKREVIQAYLKTSASMSELSELHGILESNTLADWLKKTDI
jgi:transposase-like protein